MEDIYVRQTDDGDALYCSKCKAEILHTEQEFQRLVKHYNIDLAKVSRDTDKNVRQNLNKTNNSIIFTIFGIYQLYNFVY